MSSLRCRMLRELAQHREDLSPEQQRRVVETALAACNDGANVAFTTSQLDVDIRQALAAASGNSDRLVQIMARKLCDGKYRYINEIHHLRPGAYVRWLREGSSLLTVGGRVATVRPNDNGSMLVACRCGPGRVVQYNFNNALTFQKLSEDELIVLALNDIAASEDDDENRHKNLS